MSHPKQSEIGWPILCLFAGVAGSIIATVFLLASGLAAVPHFIVTAEGLAAVATSLALIYTWSEDRRRRNESDQQRLDRAAYLAIGFQHELLMLCGAADNLAPLVRETRRTPRIALQYCLLFVSGIKIPLLEKMADRLDVFDGKDAPLLMKVITGVLQTRSDQAPTAADIAGMSQLEAFQIAKTLVRTARLLKQDARLALKAINPYFSRYARFVPDAHGFIRRQ